MAVVNVPNCAMQPDLCRCCLSATGSWDLTAAYTTDDGIKEVYLNIIQDCYGITLTHITEWGSSRLVCDKCLKHIRDGHIFRKQVLEANQIYSTFCNSLTDSGNEIRSIDQPEETNNNIDDSDSDTPIIEIRNKVRQNKLKESEIFEENKLVLRLSNEIDFKCEGQEAQKAKTDQEYLGHKNVKQVSERKRVMTTCETVLVDTTACPFRHHKSWFRCFFCTQDFMDIATLRTHNLEAHANLTDELKKIKRFPRSLQIDISTLECRRCHLSLTDVTAMRRHLVDAHNKVIYSECIADYKVNASPYCCHLCQKQFHVFRTLTTHLNEHYANCICDVCGKSYLNTKRLKVHKRIHDQGQYPCPKCGKVLKTKTSKANHMESAHSNRVIKCQICSKPMKHYNDRIKHMSEEHNITHKFKCPICSREYNIKHYLATHIRQTHGHKNKKCSECSMAFITNHGLKKHMLKHSGVKAFSCSVCCKSYARSYSLREHMRAHDGERRVLGGSE